MTALLVGFASCYAGVEAYNREIERERLEMGVGHFIDGRMPLELPLYAAVGAFVGWWAFRLVVHYARRARPSE